MFKFTNNTRFIEYPQASRGQYSIKIEQKVQSKSDEANKSEWIAIGYITKSFNKEENHFNFCATDALGNPVFTDVKELHLLKKEFQNHGVNLAEKIRSAQIPKVKKTNPEKQIHPTERKQEIHQLRDKAKDKSQQKVQNLKTEHQMDAKQAESTAKDKGSKDNPDQPSSKDSTQPENNSIQDKTEERMDEIQDIREQGDDLNQDMDIEM